MPEGLCGTAAASAALDCNGDRLFSLHIWFRSWTTAMMCRTRLMRRFLARERRWRAWLMLRTVLSGRYRALQCASRSEIRMGRTRHNAA